MKNSPQADYASLIDAQTHDFIRRTELWYPPGTTGQSIEAQRRTYDALCREFHRDYPPEVTASDDTTGISTRHYVRASADSTTAAAQVVYFHGGGFVVGGLESHDDVCAEICQASGFPVTAIDYRLCPEHTHPAAFEDAVAGVEKAWQASQMPIVLVGDSAGGNLAAAVAHQLRSSSIKLAGQVLIYPGLGGDMSKGSYLQHANAPMLSTEEVEYYATLRASASHDKSDPTLSPLSDSDFSALPPTLVFGAECDPLSDDGKHYRDRILQAGGKAAWFNEAGLVHGYLRARSTVERAESSFKRIVEGIHLLGTGQWLNT
ncbi:alpha/beta hydrolase [Granulosicoccus antarcticus]|uniref:Carboxylesterase NlhH n=1 Tax=Granulosicoccus antarcticus IMCC3135 TaxID=1192854 RepID=A0A2Z2P394_9GAMM|nr:alpha/beta hydrolase [Granulosicoccus antarcticus]ASJ74234.1 Carboxylesterase NlhH [Granulosicoccus antarcticus IMCC3135]